MSLSFEESSTSGVPVVCLPWFSTSRAMTREALEPALARPGLRLLYLDLPGHGHSAALVPATTEAVLGAVVRFLEEQAREPALLAGCSYGGYLAAAVARRRPDLVRGLLLVCPGVRRTRDLPEAGGAPAEDGWLDVAPEHLRGHFEAALGNRTARVVRQVTAGLAAGGPGDDGFQEALQGGGAYFLDDDDDVGRPFEGPVAVVAGKQDRVVGFADQLRQLSRYPRGTFVAADLAGHYLPYERPDVLRAVGQDWLERCGL